MPQDKKLADASGELLHSTFRGQGSPKRSKVTVGMISGEPDPGLWYKRHSLKEKLRSAIPFKRKRTRARKYGQFPVSLDSSPITSPGTCLRRIYEFSGLWRVAEAYEYSFKPTLISPIGGEIKKVYEIQVGFDPFCSFTSLDEAIASYRAMVADGWAPIVREYDLRR